MRERESNREDAIRSRKGENTDIRRRAGYPSRGKSIAATEDHDKNGSCRWVGGGFGQFGSLSILVASIRPARSSQVIIM